MSVAPPKAKSRYPMWMKGLGLLLSLCGSPGCMQPDGPPNILLVTIDTLRADHLAFYGYERSTMPHLEAWLDQAALFERCYSPLPGSGQSAPEFGRLANPLLGRGCGNPA